MGHSKFQKNLRLLKHTDMTTHWKALEEHFLMVPLVFQFNHFREMHFWDFSQPSVLKESILFLCLTILGILKGAVHCVTIASCFY
jgi:hypothetical protein